MKVDFIFDFASPNAYFCHKLIPIIEDRTDVSFNYIPCLNSRKDWVETLSKLSEKRKA